MSTGRIKIVPSFNQKAPCEQIFNIKKNPLASKLKVIQLNPLKSLNFKIWVFKINLDKLYYKTF